MSDRDAVFEGRRKISKSIASTNGRLSDYNKIAAVNIKSMRHVATREKLWEETFCENRTRDFNPAITLSPRASIACSRDRFHDAHSVRILKRHRAAWPLDPTREVAGLRAVDAFGESLFEKWEPRIPP